MRQDTGRTHQAYIWIFSLILKEEAQVSRGLSENAFLDIIFFTILIALFIIEAVCQVVGTHPNMVILRVIMSCLLFSYTCPRERSAPCPGTSSLLDSCLLAPSWTLAAWSPASGICSLVSCLLRVVGLWAASCWSRVSVWPVFSWLVAESQVSG